MIQLPEQYVITGKDPLKKAQFLEKMEQCLLKGYGLIQLRAKNLEKNQYGELALEANHLCEKHKAILMLNCEVKDAVTSKVRGLHLTSKRLMSLSKRPDKSIVSASCHDKAQIERANALRLDFITVSPVLPTATHPEAKTLGWDTFAELCRQSNVPVYALGGIVATDLKQAKHSGAYGVAAIRAFWNGNN
jgi:8-oxo-dGTP diphosphatase